MPQMGESTAAYYDALAGRSLQKASGWRVAGAKCASWRLETFGVRSPVGIGVYKCFRVLKGLRASATLVANSCSEEEAYGVFP
jgi:hypothetical protein